MTALVGYRPSRVDLELMARSERDLIDLRVFSNVAHEKLAYADREDEWRDVFRALDSGGGKLSKGFLTLADIEEAMQSMGVALPDSCDCSLRALFDELDSDADGRVTFADFCAAMSFCDSAGAPVA